MQPGSIPEQFHFTVSPELQSCMHRNINVLQPKPDGRQTFLSVAAYFIPLKSNHNDDVRKKQKILQ
jgi:hypothetical protein